MEGPHTVLRVSRFRLESCCEENDPRGIGCQHVKCGVCPLKPVAINEIRPEITVSGWRSTLEQLCVECLSAPQESEPVLARSCGQKFVKLYGLGCIVLFQSEMINEVETRGFKVSHMYRKAQLLG